MRNLPLLVFFISFYALRLSAQVDTLEQAGPKNIFTAGFDTRGISVDLSNPEEVELVLKKIHTFRYLESLVLEGEADPATLKKVGYRLSALKNLNSLTLKENGLSHVPESFTGLKTLRNLSVEGNPDLDYEELFRLLRTVPLVQLNLLDNDLKKVPAALGEISSLRKLQLTGSAQLDYTELFDQLARLPALTTLSIAVNYISELPANISKLKTLQVLDVSENNLTELPQELSVLKAINNLSIQGNLLMDPAKDLEKLKGLNIKYLALDKEISGEDLESIKKLFPAAQIDFPISKEEQEALEIKKTGEERAAAQPVYSGELKAKKDTRILSGAYLLYPMLYLPYNFDTLTFEERYNNLRYENVYRKLDGRVRAPITALYFRTKLAYYEKPGEKSETWFYITGTSINYLELGAFSGMYWVYKGELSKKKFRKAFLTKKIRPEGKNWLGLRRFRIRQPIYWNDLRIDFDKNNGLFALTLKTDTGFIKITAYPRFQGSTMEHSRKAYPLKFNIYQKLLLRRMQRFKREQSRSKARYDLNYGKMKDYTWKELQLRMSDEEKLMSKEEWLMYYDEVVASEQKLIESSELSEPYILRDLGLHGYTLQNATVQPAFQRTVSLEDFATKTVGIDFIDTKGGGRQAVSRIFIVDNKNKIINQVTGTLGLSPNQLAVKQFASYSILVEMRNGNWGAVDAMELDRQTLEPNKNFKFSTKVFDKNLDSIGDLIKAAGIH